MSRVIRGRRDLLYDPKDHGDLCGRFDLVYDPKGHGIIRVRRDLFYDPKGHGDLYGRFHLVYDTKRSQGHLRSPWPTLWPKGHGDHLLSVWPSLWPKKGHRVIRGRHDLLYDPKSHGNLYG